MRNTTILLFVLISYGTNAQFSIQPQIGLENSRTSIKSNGFSSFSPMGMQLDPRLAARMGYRFKMGHGVFVGVATGSQGVKLKFNDPQAAATTYTSTGRGLQLHLEGGYQYSTKPIALGKAGSANKVRQRCGGEAQHSCISKAGCGQYRSSSHCSKASGRATATSTNKGMYMRIVPSARLAFRPSGTQKIGTATAAGQTIYEYATGWNTAFIAGTAFEFGNRKQSNFVVSINFLKSLGNNKETINNVVNGKPNATTFTSDASYFSINLGIPIHLKKNNVSSQKKEYIQRKECIRSTYQHRCGQYRMYIQ